MSIQQSSPQSLISMMPPEAQKQVFQLIKRLGDQKQEKEALQMKCQQYQNQIAQLKKELQRLNKENVQLKAKWQHSFDMVAKVRENFGTASKSKEKENNQQLVKDMSVKNLRFNKEKEQENLSEEQQDEAENKNCKIEKKGNLQEQANLKPQQTVKPNTFSISSPLQTLQTTRSQHPSKVTQVLLPSCKKPPIYSWKPSQTNRSSSSKKQQIELLKQQISSLEEDIRSKETSNLSLDEKRKRCEEIKNRYKKGNSEEEISGSRIMDSNRKLESSRKDQNILINTSAVNQSSFYSPKKYNSTQLNDQNNMINLNQQSQQYSEPLNTPKQSNLQQKFNFNSTLNLNESFHKENISLNHTNYIMSTPSNHSFVNINANGNSFMPKKSVIVQKSAIKQESFYDDGLLDLIEEMNQ